MFSVRAQLFTGLRQKPLALLSHPGTYDIHQINAGLHRLLLMNPLLQDLQNVSTVNVLTVTILSTPNSIQSVYNDRLSWSV